MATQPRKDAPRLARPAARYWKGKAPKGVDTAALSDSDEDDVKQEEEGHQDLPIGGQDDDEEEEDDSGNVIKQARPRPAKSMNVALRDVKVEVGGKVIVGGKLESGRTAMEISHEEESEEEEGEPGVKQGEESSSEDESSSEEESSEEEQPKHHFRPVFVPKRGRETVIERETESQNSEAALAKKKAEEEQRKKDSHDLVAESIKRELAEKQATENIPDVDDADGLDPEAEFEAWRLRELGRIKRDKAAQLARELEREEIERRRAMPEEQRLKEDLERAQKLRDEKPKGQQKFLQKYYHKGAFHQDEEVLKRHDFTEATVSTIDISLLPKVMQVKNFGKRSQTKYTHLADQDTTLSHKDPSKPGGSTINPNVQCFLCGGPHIKRDCPQNQGVNGTTGSNNANAAPGQQRKWGVGSRAAEDAQAQQQRFGGGSSDWRKRDGDRERASRRSRSPPHSRGKHQDDDRDGNRRRPRSRSRSPPSRARGHDDRDRRRESDRRDDDHRRRSRSRSRDRERARDEKRRRVQ